MATLSLPTSHSLAKMSLDSHWRALWAVAWREWLIFVRYPSWILQMFIWPVIFPLMYIFTGRALSGPDASGLQHFMQVSGASEFNGYVIIGTTIWMWQNVVLWNVGFALRNEQWRGTLESNWMTPTWRFAYLLGSSFPQIASMGMFLAVTAIEAGLIFGVRLHGSPWLILLVMAACIPAIYGLGFAFASIVITAKEANTFVFLVRGLVMIFCGVSFPLSMLPGWMQGVAYWLPQTHMIDAMRQAALSSASLSQLMPTLTILLAFGSFWLVAGYILFQWMERRARQTGAIGQY